jgi:hypothetical protein
VDEHQSIYPALEAALGTGAELSCIGDRTTGGYVRVAYLGREKRLAAVGIGLTLGECLTAVELDCATGGPMCREFEARHCSVCALNHLAPVGSQESVSALDGYLLAANRGFQVVWDGQRFFLTAHWWRKVSTPRDILEQVIREQVAVRWRHGDFAFETVPIRGKEKWLAQTKTTARPEGTKKTTPTEERKVEVLGKTLAEALFNAEGPITNALQEDDEWFRLVRRFP